jgi:hypothetical protein
MKKKRNVRKKNIKEDKENFGEKFVSFGNKRSVFWSITFATIFLSLIGIPVMIQDDNFLMRFLIIWILEIIYIGTYMQGKRRK